jgi:mannose-6-phosphate isomerase-like protein (cupin superfamily)
VEEIWYVLAGRGDVWRCPPDGDPTQIAAITVEPGATLVIPTRWRFQFRAAAESSLRFLCVTTPPWPGPEEAQPAAAGALGTPTA